MVWLALNFLNAQPPRPWQAMQRRMAVTEEAERKLAKNVPRVATFPVVVDSRWLYAEISF